MSSQYEEDKIISDFFGDYVGTFLDLGAGDGQLGSNTYELSKRGWSGLCVEPNAESFSELRKLYMGNKRVRLLQGAVSSNGRLLAFFHHYEQLSTGIDSLAMSDEWYWVPSIRGDNLPMMENRFDFVSLDCEGMDQEIAENSDWVFKSASLLCYEHDFPRHSADADYDKKWKSILEGLGLTKVIGKTKGNTLVTRP